MTSLSMTLEPLRTTPPETVFVRQITGELDEKYFIVTAYDSGSGSLDRRRGNSGTALLATQLVRGLVGAPQGRQLLLGRARVCRKVVAQLVQEVLLAEVVGPSAMNRSCRPSCDPL